MSLQYESVREYLKPWSNLDSTLAKNYLKRIFYLYSDDDQIDLDIYDILFLKTLRGKVKLHRDEQLGIYLSVELDLAYQTSIDLHFDNKKHRDIKMVIAKGEDLYFFEPSVKLQKLILDKLPTNVRNVLLYYIYSPTKHDLADIEQYEGPIEEDENFVKTKMNYPPNWRMSNKWENISNFTFSLLEVTHHTQYEEGFQYPLTLDLRVCKEMCRPDEESIVIVKKFKRSF